MKSTAAQQPGRTAVRPTLVKKRPIRIAVVGTGRVGLVTAACLASFEHRVAVFDLDAARIEQLQQLTPVVHETGLLPLLRDEVAAQRLRFCSDVSEALAGADLVFVAVDTPARADGGLDMREIDRLTATLAPRVRAPSVVVLQSTLPVGSAERIRTALGAAPGAAPWVLGNPLFLREGCALVDFLKPDRLIIGDDATDDTARRLLLSVYAPLVSAGVPVLTMSTRSAELAKLAANAMLAARISFVNEIAGIAAATGADIEQVRAGIGSDRRIGQDYLHAGLGYGGPCFPSDVAALRETARRSNLRSDMLLATERVNNRQRCWAFDALQRDMGSRAALRGLHAAVWGLAFKPGTDDICDAPSLGLIDRLARAGVCMILYDPAAMVNARAHLGDDRHIRWADSAEAALRGADVLLLVTEWPEFMSFEPARAAAALGLGIVYDGRNVLDAAAWTAGGLRVVQVGQPNRPAHAPLRAAGARSAPALRDHSDAEVEWMHGIAP